MHPLGLLLLIHLALFVRTFYTVPITWTISRLCDRYGCESAIPSCARDNDFGETQDPFNPIFDC